MKRADVVIGQSYAYAPWQGASVLQRFDATGFEEGSVPISGSWNGRSTRKTTRVVGVLHRTEGAPPAPIKIEARKLVGPWDAYVVKRQAADEAHDRLQAERAAAEAVRTPQVEALVKRLAEVGVTLAAYEQAKAVRLGRVELRVETLVELLGL